MRDLKQIMMFTLIQKIRKKSFLVTTLILMIMMSLFMNISYILTLINGGSTEADVFRIGLITEEQYEPIAKLLQGHFENDTSNNIEIYPVPTRGSLDDDDDEALMMQWIQEKRINGYLRFDDSSQHIFPNLIYKGQTDLASVKASLEEVLEVVKLETVLQNVLSEEQQILIQNPIQIAFEEVIHLNEGVQSETQQTMTSNVILVIIMLLFMSVSLTANMVASEVTGDKSSRIMEILLTTVAPIKQMYGKVLGVFFVGLIQIGLLVMTVFLNMQLPHNVSSTAVDLSLVDPKVYVFAAIFYILSFLLYALLSATIGSTVSRTEDLGQAMMPVTMTMLFAFYIGSFSLSAPDSLLLKITSYIPFFTPISMLVRIGGGNISWWEISGAIIILIAAIAFMGWLSAKIYRVGVLMYGKRPSIKEIKKAMQVYK